MISGASLSAFGFTFSALSPILQGTHTNSNIVKCQGVIQLGGLLPGYSMQVPLRLNLVSLFNSLMVTLKLKTMNTWLI